MRWSLFADVDQRDVDAVLAAARRRQFSKGDTVFYEGDPGSTLHLIDRGHVAVRVLTPMGETATLRVLGPGDYFGDLAVISPAPRSATITALDAVETLSVHRGVFDELRHRHPSVDQVLLEAVIQEVRRLSIALLDALYVPVPKRATRRLVELADLYGASADRGNIVVPLTQEDLAGLTGTTRQTMNQILMELSAAGIVSLARGRVVVEDLDALRARAR